MLIRLLIESNWCEQIRAEKILKWKKKKSCSYRRKSFSSSKSTVTWHEVVIDIVHKLPLVPVLLYQSKVVSDSAQFLKLFIIACHVSCLCGGEWREEVMEITSHFVDGKDREKAKLAQDTFRGYFFNKHQFEFLLIERKILRRKNYVVKLLSIQYKKKKRASHCQFLKPWTA